MRDFRPFLTRLLLCMAATFCLPATAQTFCGEHKYDGEHKNEVSGYIVGGRNVVTGVLHRRRPECSNRRLRWNVRILQAPHHRPMERGR